jgi:hypothetical protein
VALSDAQGDAGVMKRMLDTPARPAPIRHVMIRCPNSGEGVPAGSSVDASAFTAGGSEERVLLCPHCHEEHTWSMKDAWLEESF